ncbi:C-4 sterol methyl oxidase [Cladochytrium tenue]|nr:C-4 sterol methyl oxidase [Cladochytrium tenue]
MSRQLSWLEAQWLSLFRDNAHPGMTLAAVLFGVQELAFLGRFLPYYIMDQIPFFLKYKIQGAATPAADVRRVLVHVLLSQVLLQLPMMMMFYGTCLFLGVELFAVPFPPVWVLAAQQLYFALCEDTYQYWVHRAAHFGPLYKYVHKVHHEFQAPFGIEAQYTHPLEVLLIGGPAFFSGPLSWALYFSAASPATPRHLVLHVFSIALWLAVRMVLTVDGHSGYDFPWSLHHWLPVWAGADYHDFHHMAFVGCYSSTFRYWDWLCGTDKQYREHASRIRSMRRSKRLAATLELRDRAAREEEQAYGAVGAGAEKKAH